MTHYHTLLMTTVTVILGILVYLARTAKSGRQDYFPPFLICFLILFYATGVGNGSTFQQVTFYTEPLAYRSPPLSVCVSRPSCVFLDFSRALRRSQTHRWQLSREGVRFLIMPSPPPKRTNTQEHVHQRR